MKTDRHIETFTAEWHGITLEIVWEPCWLNFSSSDGYETAHLEVRSVSPEDAPLPITETGYRSHFTSAETVTSFGGPVDFVLAWLDEEATTPAWRDREQAARQFALF